MQFRHPFSDELVRSIFGQFLPLGLIARFEPVAGATGFSGATICKIGTLDGQSLCLRGWPPEHPTPQRLALIHAVLTHVAARRIEFIPPPLKTASGETFVSAYGRLWELTPWLPGIAADWTRPEPAKLSAAFAALARFHRAAASFGQPQPARAPAPAIAERLALVNELLAGGLAEYERLTEPMAGEIVALVRGRLAPLQTALAIAARRPLPLQPAIRDIHGEHVLFSGDEVTGIIDFGALRIDTPLVDIARLLGSVAGSDRDLRAAACDAYGELHAVSDEDRALVELLDESGLVLAGLNWLRWLHIERRQFDNLPAVQGRLRHIIARLTTRLVRVEA
ncbi:MAG: phosphotransferase [Pirellulaceae bacterium]|nr:phosphotransferase [Pirellulaceae bacterium]